MRATGLILAAAFAIPGLAAATGSAASGPRTPDSPFAKERAKSVRSASDFLDKLVRSRVPDRGTGAQSCTRRGEPRFRFRCDFDTESGDDRLFWKGAGTITAYDVRTSGYRYRYAIEGTVRDCTTTPCVTSPFSWTGTGTPAKVRR